MQKLDLGVDFDPEQTETVVPNGTAVPPNSANMARSSSQPAMTSSRTQTMSATPMKSNKTLSTILLVVALAAGALTGLGAFKLKAKASGLSGSGAPMQQVAGSVDSIKANDVFGSADESAFKDSAEGYLQIGGFQGEGSHHLLRPGGDSQTVYLVSSVTDLDKFDGMQVKVWGETNKGQKVGWLMDVGRIQVIDPHGTPPAGSAPSASGSAQNQDQ